MKIEFEGIEEAQKKIAGIRRRMKDARSWLEWVQEDIAEGMEETFNSGGIPAWKPRKEPTGSWPVLDKTGKLRDSVASSRKGGGSIARLNKERLEMGTSVEYGKYHQQPEELRGLSKGIMPYRPFLQFLPEQFAEWHKKAVRYFWYGEGEVLAPEPLEIVVSGNPFPR